MVTTRDHNPGAHPRRAQNATSVATPDRMRALVLRELNGPDGLVMARTPLPEDGDGRVLIDVHVAGVSFPDVLLTRGLYQTRPELPFIPGGEVAGLVRSAPSGCGLRPGQRVAALLTTGGFAEVASAPATRAVAVPEDIDLETAAALMINYHTAHFALQRRATLRAGEVLLVHGGAGGIGTAAIQVGRALGAEVLATARGEEGLRVAAEAGAEQVVELVPGWRERLLSLTGGRGFDVVLDPVGGELFDESVRCLAPEGRLLVIGFAGGDIPHVRVNRLLLRNASVVGVALGAFLEREPALLNDTHEALIKMVRAGYVAPVVGARYPLEDGGQALRDLVARRVRGKPLLTVRERGAPAAG